MTGGNFGVWGGMFSTFDCAVKGWRQKEDAWNAIISGFMTGGCLAARSESLCSFYTPDFSLRATFTLISAYLVIRSCITRWSKVRPRISHCVWHSTWCFRGCRCPAFPCLQRGHATTTTSMYVSLLFS